MLRILVSRNTKKLLSSKVEQKDQLEATSGKDHSTFQKQYQEQRDQGVVFDFQVELVT